MAISRAEFEALDFIAQGRNHEWRESVNQLYIPALWLYVTGGLIFYVLFLRDLHNILGLAGKSTPERGQ